MNYDKLKNRGITLIALIITIIVMLILVGVTINVALSGGLFSTAKKAVRKTNEAIKDEKRIMAITNAAMHEKEWVYTTKDGDKIPIPAHFAPTEIEGEDSIEEGLVVIDDKGNEFVWIPCTLEQYKLAKFQDGTNGTEKWKDFWYDGGTWNETDGVEYAQTSLTNLGTRKTKGELTENGVGFYVARYEAGIPENSGFYGNSEGASYYLDAKKNDTASIKDLAPVSKKGYPVWNFISQTNSVSVAKNMHPGHSYLIDSHAWNYICDSKFSAAERSNSNKIGNYKDNTTTKYEELDVLYAVHEYSDGYCTKVAGGTEGGDDSKYHKGLIPTDTRKENNRLELSTGASDDFKKYNIYDMAGNVYEWTTEGGTSSSGRAGYVVLRGGSFTVSGGDVPVVRANGNVDSGYKYVNLGFRVVLYL